MEKYEEEEIPLLDLETGLDSEDAQSYFEAFKEFDHKNTGHISIRVHASNNTSIKFTNLVSISLLAAIAVLQV